MDKDNFTRLVTSNVPVGVLPRREAISFVPPPCHRAPH
jgi:hypothetical protein